MNIIHYSECPSCNSRNIDPLITIKDHSVSKEEFVLWQCSDCSLRFTQDVPSEDSIGPYYKSDNYISHTNTSKGLLNRLYQSVRKYTLRQKAGLIISKTKPQGLLLDVGAGIGAFAATMIEKGWEVKGIEPDEGARRQARELFGLELFSPSKLKELPVGGFDAITLWHVLEHVHDLHVYLETMKKLLAPEGRIFIAVPNYKAADADVYKTYWAAYDVPRHLYHFSPRSMDLLMQKHGMAVEEKRPMWFDSYYISLLSSQYRNGKTSWIGAGITGTRSNLKALINNENCSSVLYVVKKN
jgi:SAM-dependent methyltransferase